MCENERRNQSIFVISYTQLFLDIQNATWILFVHHIVCRAIQHFARTYIFFVSGRSSASEKIINNFGAKNIWPFERFPSV